MNSRNKEGKGGYASVNGLNMYYEVHGTSRPPLVLLHGALSAIGTSFERVLPSLAKTRRVIAIGLRGGTTLGTRLARERAIVREMLEGSARRGQFSYM